MAINYKKELEDAAKSMILVHEPDVLIKMIVRMIVRRVKISHAGILLHDKQRDTFVLTVSRGVAGLKIPAGFARMDSDNPLIRFLNNHRGRAYFSNEALVFHDLKRALKRRIALETKELLKGALYQMEIFDAAVVIPSYFREELLGVLLLGKKTDKRRFHAEELDFFMALTSDVAMAIRNARLFQELELELQKNQHLFLHTIISLAATIDARDNYTAGHTERVTTLSLNIARRYSQAYAHTLDEKFQEHLRIASLLHDIGKIGTPESILKKEGPLNDEEKKKMQEHAIEGTTILRHIKELGDSILGVKYHHERYDGTGYPEGLKGEQIPLIASIIAVADTFDAMTTDRPYRRGLSKEEAAVEIRRLSGIQFNPQVAEAFTSLYNEGKV